MRTHKKYIRDATNIYYSSKELEDVKTLCAIAQQLDARNVLPATSGNLSVRTSKDQFLITRSGYHKKLTNPAHFLRINVHNASPVSVIAPKPSDETKLHATVYSLFPEINSVVHCHAAKFDAWQTPHFKFEGHELLKGLGYKTHTEPFCLPVFKNTQDMDKLSKEINEYFSNAKLKSKDLICAFYLENHGIYCFGTNPQNTLNKLEVFLYFR